MSHHYDVAVIGMQRSGIISAALLAKRGARVLLIDHGENATGYRRQGLSLPLVPSLVPSLDSAPHVRRVVHELGIGPELKVQQNVLNPGFQAVMEGHRLDIQGDTEALARELSLEFPELGNAPQEFLTQLFALDDELTRYLDQDPVLPRGGFGEQIFSRGAHGEIAHLNAPFGDHSLMAAFPADHPVRDLLLSPLCFFGHLPDDEPTTFHAVRLLARYLSGTVTFPDEQGGLTGLLVRAALRAGVDIHRDAVVRQINLAGKRVAAMEIEEDRHTYSADFFIANTLGPFEKILPPGKVHTRYLAELQSLRPVGSLLVMNLVVDSQVIPKGMGEALFLLNGRRQQRGDDPVDPPVFMRRYPAQRSSVSPDGAAAISTHSPPKPRADPQQQVLSVACPARTEVVTRSPERLAALKSLLFERVKRVVPFLDDYLIDRSLPIDTGSWDIEGGNRRIDPLSIHPIYRHHKRPLLGIAGRRTRTPVKNLVHCGFDVVPGLGLEGEYVAGLEAAKAVGKMGGKRFAVPPRR